MNEFLEQNNRFTSFTSKYLVYSPKSLFNLVFHCQVEGACLSSTVDKTSMLLERGMFPKPRVSVVLLRKTALLVTEGVIQYYYFNP